MFIKLCERVNGCECTLLNLDNVEAVYEYMGGIEVRYVGGRAEPFDITLEEIEMLIDLAEETRR